MKSLHVVLSIALVLTFCSSAASAITNGSTDNSTVELAISELSANLKRMEKRVATLEAHAGIPRRVDLVVPTEVQRQGGARQPDEMAAALSMDYQELGDLGQKIRLHEGLIRLSQEKDQVPTESAASRSDP